LAQGAFVAADAAVTQRRDAWGDRDHDRINAALQSD
jgi:hypothetical protein